MTLYEEIHPLARFCSPRVHGAFLAKLKALLPEGVRPILLTDAGFRETNAAGDITGTHGQRGEIAGNCAGFAVFLRVRAGQ